MRASKRSDFIMLSFGRDSQSATSCLWSSGVLRISFARTFYTVSIHPSTSNLNSLCICKVNGNGNTKILSQTLYCAIHVISIASRVQNTVSVFTILIGQGIYVIYTITPLQLKSTFFELIRKHAVDLTGDSLHCIDRNHAEQFCPHNVRIVLLLFLANTLLLFHSRVHFCFERKPLRLNLLFP